MAGVRVRPAISVAGEYVTPRNQGAATVASLLELDAEERHADGRASPTTTGANLSFPGREHMFRQRPGGDVIRICCRRVGGESEDILECHRAVLRACSRARDISLQHGALVETFKDVSFESWTCQSVDGHALPLLVYRPDARQVLVNAHIATDYFCSVFAQLLLAESPAKLAPKWSSFLARIFKPRPFAPPSSRPVSKALRSAYNQLFALRYIALPRLRQRAHSRLYRYWISRQLRKHPLQAAGIHATLRRRRQSPAAAPLSKDALEQSSTENKMAYNNDLSGFRSEGREPGARRRKLAGYLKAANELRQSYFSGDGASYDADAGPDSSFPDAAIVRTGNEEMILFPSYARKHIKSRTQSAAAPNESEQDFWQREWDQHQSDNALVDVDVRGWLYTPHRGPATRKQRLVLGIARQMSGLPAPGASEASPASSSFSSQIPSRSSSPAKPKQEEDLITLEAENIIRRGEAEERRAQRGEFSERPHTSRAASPDRGTHVLQASNLSRDDDSAETAFQRQSSVSQPARMTQAELKTANDYLTQRMRPFMANALANTPVSAFFYNDKSSRQHTVYTDTSGHFTLRAMLDFVPTHVRVFAGEKLSATEEVIITSAEGVSLISDVDDTIKHSAISHGAREIFRNAFLRDLNELTIEGVREWYNTLHDMGVKLHYVSNSPWQMYPLLSSFFKLAHLPRGSFHLKQYTGLFQGIFEPVAERKKSSLDRIMRDFPGRKFMLVGDSGEADLEVYTDVALENPGKILGIFIRDVTTPVETGYFNSTIPAISGKGRRSRNHSRHASGDMLAMSKKLSRPEDIKNDDVDLKAAIAASLADMEEETRRARRSINPDAFGGRNEDRTAPPLPTRRRGDPIQPGSQIMASPEKEEDLIDFSDPPAAAPTDLLSLPTRANAQHKSVDNTGRQRPSPSPPPKPQSLRSPSPNPQTSGEMEAAAKVPPPRPRKPSSAVVKPLTTIVNSQTHQPSPLSNVSNHDGPKERPPLPARRTYREIAKEKLVNATSPIMRAISAPNSPRSFASVSSKDMDDFSLDGAGGNQPPALPKRRNLSGISFSGTRPVSNRWSGNFDDESLPSSPGEAGMSRKEWLWRQRWAKAQSILEPRGVTLRTWRVGTDVADVCVKLAEMALRDMEKETAGTDRR